MTTCDRHRQIQDFLDHEMGEREARDFERHLTSCSECSVELALYRRAFVALERLPLRSPSPALTERVLARVAPSQVRRRWVARMGWCYAAALAVSIGAALLWASQPGPRALLESLSAVASRRLIESTTFVLNSLAFTFLSLANGWSWIALVVEPLAPLVRAAVALLSQPVVQSALAMAAVSCIAVLWWMRPRERKAGRKGYVAIILSVSG
jgi:hypothetical protein